MTKSESSNQAPLSGDETEALNKHGVFFKKRILHTLQQIPGVSIVSEELGVTFGVTRVIDELAADVRKKPHLMFVFECKRAYAAEKRWIFFRDMNPNYRALRVQNGLVGHSSVFTASVPPFLVVCSEGYEFSKKEKKADQNPIFQAASQLSAGYLGLIARREREMRPIGGTAVDTTERYVPVLVTTAELVLVQADLSRTSTETGNLDTPPNGTSVDFLVLKHPFPTPEGLVRDFRDETKFNRSATVWSQLHKESVYVVRASALARFMAADHCDAFRSMTSES